MGIAIGLLALVCLGLFILSIPIDVTVAVETQAREKFRIRFAWLFGFLKLSPHRREKRKEKRRERKTRRKRRITLPRLVTILRTKGLLMAVVRWARRLWAGLALRDCRLHLRFGLEDPADTGLLLAAAAPATWLIQRLANGRFSLVPDFSGDVFLAEGAVTIRIYPIRVVAASAILLLTPATLRAAKVALWHT